MFQTTNYWCRIMNAFWEATAGSALWQNIKEPGDQHAMLHPLPVDLSLYPI